MRLVFTLFICLMLAAGEAAFAVDSTCSENAIEEIVQSIELPDIPDTEFDIRDFGATEGGVEDARAAGSWCHPESGAATARWYCRAGSNCTCPKGRTCYLVSAPSITCRLS